MDPSLGAVSAYPRQSGGPKLTAAAQQQIARHGERRAKRSPDSHAVPPVRVSRGHLQMILNPCVRLVFAITLMTCANRTSSRGARSDVPNTPRQHQQVGSGTRSKHHAERSVKPSAKPTQVRTLDLPPIYPQVRPGPAGRSPRVGGAVCMTVGSASLTCLQSLTGTIGSVGSSK